MTRLYTTALRLRVAARDEPVRLRGWSAIAATIVLQAVILASQGLGPWAIAGALAAQAIPLLGLEAARAQVTPWQPPRDDDPPTAPPPAPAGPPGRAGNVRVVTGHSPAGEQGRLGR